MTVGCWVGSTLVRFAVGPSSLPPCPSLCLAHARELTSHPSPRPHRLDRSRRIPRRPPHDLYRARRGPQVAPSGPVRFQDARPLRPLDGAGSTTLVRRASRVGASPPHAPAPPPCVAPRSLSLVLPLRHRPVVLHRRFSRPSAAPRPPFPRAQSPPRLPRPRRPHLGRALPAPGARRSRRARRRRRSCSGGRPGAGIAATRAGYGAPARGCCAGRRTLPGQQRGRGRARRV